MVEDIYGMLKLVHCYLINPALIFYPLAMCNGGGGGGNIAYHSCPCVHAIWQTRLSAVVTGCGL